MSAQTHFPSPQAFRMALEHRLRTEAKALGVPLNRLRKEAAFNRLLARMWHAAPDTWALKGGLALIARVSLDVRGTRDADVNWRSTRDHLENTLSEVEELDLTDWFEFTIGDGRPLQGEGEAGALRYPVVARLDGRVFERVSLDLNLVGPQDSRPVQPVAFNRNAFAFVDEPALEIPMVRPEHQLAEKLHAYTRSYRGESSSRAKDLFDMLVIADQLELPTGPALAGAVRETFRLRDTAWPPVLRPPPTAWAGPWAAFVAEYPLPWNGLPEAFAALRQFWEPVLDGPASGPGSIWEAGRWRWTVPTG